MALLDGCWRDRRESSAPEIVQRLSPGATVWVLPEFANAGGVGLDAGTGSCCREPLASPGRGFRCCPERGVRGAPSSNHGLMVVGATDSGGTELGATEPLVAEAGGVGAGAVEPAAAAT